jgi:hypothetical protein
LTADLASLLVVTVNGGPDVIGAGLLGAVA